MKRTNRTTSLLVASVIALVAAGALYSYLYVSADTFAERALRTRNILRNAEAARLQTKEILQLDADTTVGRDKLAGFFVPAGNAVEVIKTIESIGSATGADVTISSINASPAAGDSPVGRVSAAVSIAGTWKQVIQALELFETLPYDRSMNGLVLRTSAASVTPSSAVSEGHRWNADFDLSVATISQK